MTRRFDLAKSPDSRLAEFSGGAPNVTDHVAEFQRGLTTDPAAI
jgi:hypothetical protein